MPRVATETRRNVGGRKRRGGGGKSVLPKLVAQGRSDNISESAARLVDVYIDSAVVCARRRVELVARSPREGANAGTARRKAIFTHP